MKVATLDNVFKWESNMIFPFAAAVIFAFQKVTKMGHQRGCSDFVYSSLEELNFVSHTHLSHMHTVQ